jgi:hypothetical protein
LKRILLILAFLIPSPALAATNATTTGVLTVNANDTTLSVRAKFTGDDNANNSALIEYKKHSDVTWIAAYAPFIDRRQYLTGVANTNVNEARGIVIGLLINTSYDVRITWSDADGVSGSNPVEVDSTTTYNTAPSEGATTCTATDLSTLNTCITGLNNGTKNFLHINAGTYSQAAGFTISATGSLGSYVVIEGEAIGTTLLTGGTNADLNITGSFIIVRQLVLPQSNKSGIVIGASAHDIIVNGNAIQSVSASTVATDCPGSGTAAGYNNTGIFLTDGATKIYVLNNVVAASAQLNLCNQSPIYDSPSAGIAWCSNSHNVVAFNTVTGSFRDAITADSDDCQTENNNIHDNVTSGFKDDGNESKGWNINTKSWNNRILVTQATVPVCNTATAPRCGTNGQPSAYGNTCHAFNTNSTSIAYGPIWIFRNQCYADFDGGGGEAILKQQAVYPYRIFHNSWNTNTIGVNWDGLNSAGGWSEVYNNIAKSLNGNLLVNGQNGLIKAVTISGDATGVTAGTYTAKKPTGGTNSCVKASGGIYQVSFDVTVAAGVYTAILIRDPGYSAGRCAVNDTLVIPGTAFTGGTSPARDLTITVASVTGYTADNNLFYQVNNDNNWGKQWDFTDSTTSPTTLSYLSLGGFTTGTGQDTNSIGKTTNPSFQNGTDATSMVILNTSQAANKAKALTMFNGSSSGWPFTTANASIGYYEANAGGCTPDHLTFIAQPQNAGLAATLGTVTVGVYNASNVLCNTDTSNVTVAKTAGATWGTLAGTLTKAAVAGIATFTDLNVTTTIGSGSITATDAALTAGVSNTFTISTPCTPDHLAFTDQPANAPSGVSFGTTIVAVQDASNVTCNDTRVITLSKHAGTCLGQTLGGTVSGAAILGLFTTTTGTLTGTPGACRLDANATGVTGTTSTQFSVVTTGPGGRAGVLLKGKH